MGLLPVTMPHDHLRPLGFSTPSHAEAHLPRAAEGAHRRSLRAATLDAALTAGARDPTTAQGATTAAGPSGAWCVCVCAFLLHRRVKGRFSHW